MKTTLFIPFLLVMAVTLLCKAHAHTLEHHKPPGNNTWELLQAVANRIGPLYDPNEIREWDAERYFLWDRYLTSTASEIPSVILGINEEVTQWEYINSRIDMIGLFLFGPENGRSIIRSVRVPGQEVLVDDLQCFKSTTQLFYKHCGCIHEHCLRRYPAFASMCNHAVDKTAIKEALAFACGLDQINYLVNVENPTITHFAPAPVHNSSEYCERISVEGVSRTKLGSFAKMYRVLLNPPGWWDGDEDAQICLHRDASLGLCQCEKDDWRSLENEEWSFVMSPYEQLFVDVKFGRGTHGLVSVYLHEVSQGWRYVLFAIGFSLLFLAPVASKCLPSEYSSTVRILAVRAMAVTFIFQSSMDTLFAKVAVAACSTVCILVRFIKDPVTSENLKLERLNGREVTEDRGYEFHSHGKKNTTVKDMAIYVSFRFSIDLRTLVVKAGRSFAKR